MQNNEEWNETFMTNSSIQYEEDACLGLMGGGSVADAILMWNKPSEILGRRRREVRLMVSGNYGDGKANVFPVDPNTHHPIYRKGTMINVF